MTYITPEPYIGHLGLDGVGDTKGLLESEIRGKHIKWMHSARIRKVEDGKMMVEQVNDDGTALPERELPHAFAMIPPAFRGIKPLMGIAALLRLSYEEVGSSDRKEPLPATPFMAGSGGGWIVTRLVARDRARV